jgi:hypothetical protein
MSRWNCYALFAFATAIFSACSTQMSRGKEVPSDDGKSYLVVEELDGPLCATVFVDGKPWPHAVHVAGAVEPGEHEIKCAAPVKFIIRTGTVFHFMYWGP